jgi:hypothetical protein
MPMPVQPAAVADVGGAVQGGQSPDNQPTPESDLTLQPAAEADSQAANSAEDAELAAHRFDREPWFAKLPPSLRDAIQSNSRCRAPRGYEERLRRYFESID